MTDDVKNERDAKSARNERLKSALRDNLKRRKSQARREQPPGMRVSNQLVPELEASRMTKQRV